MLSSLFIFYTYVRGCTLTVDIDAAFRMRRSSFVSYSLFTKESHFKMRTPEQLHHHYHLENIKKRKCLPS